MKCPVCGERLIKLEAKTKLGTTQFLVCPSGAHYFIKIIPKGER